MKDVYTLEDLRDWHEPSLRYAVLGDPVAHSASPAMHNAALEFLGRTERYCRIWIRPNELSEAIQLLSKAHFLGVNLTIPHKTGILPLLNELDPDAARLGAVNTVEFSGGRLKGYNTDGPGIVRAIREEFAVDLATQRVLILGAGGGAGRAISIQCAMLGCPSVALVNRTADKVMEVCDSITANYPRCQPIVGAFTDTGFPDWLERSDLIINCTSVGMKADDTLPFTSPLEKRHLVYDTIYVGRRTLLQKAADSAGARSANGLSLLLHQGALSLEIWLKQTVPLEVMRKGLQDFVKERR